MYINSTGLDSLFMYFHERTYTTFDRGGELIILKFSLISAFSIDKSMLSQGCTEDPLFFDMLTWTKVKEVTLFSQEK